MCLYTPVSDGCKAALSKGSIGKPLAGGQGFAPRYDAGRSHTETPLCKDLYKPLEETDHFSQRPRIPGNEIWVVFPKSLEIVKNRISMRVTGKKTQPLVLHTSLEQVGLKNTMGCNCDFCRLNSHYICKVILTVALLLVHCAICVNKTIWVFNWGIIWCKMAGKESPILFCSSSTLYSHWSC